MADFLLEIFSEEIPARMQLKAVEQLKLLFQKEAAFYNIKADKVETYVTPRRLTLHATNLPVVVKGGIEEVKGPSVNAADNAIEGFCYSLKIVRENLSIREVKGKNYYFANKEIPDQQTTEILGVIILNILRNFQWPKSMRWGGLKDYWIRPIRNILALLDDKIVPIEFAGLNSNNFTFGHRFMAPSKIEISSPYKYFDKLKNAFVILDQNERKRAILSQTQILAEKRNISLAASNVLIDEVTGLVEYPQILITKISPEFLSLPVEILITSMAINQKYFSFKNKDNSFASNFAIIANIKSENEEIIIEGNKKVLEARLYDAKFFYENDCKKTLDSQVKNLNKVVFHSKLGTILDKVKRIENISSFLVLQTSASNDVVARIAYLSKADLVTEVVYEFPELQGVMGKYYALNQKEEKIVAEGIEQHYWPIGRDDPCPQSMEASIVSIADKLDTISALFSVNERPTSSKDPFALRRSAISIIRIIIEKKLNFNLLELIDYSVKQFSTYTGLSQEIFKFFQDRLTQYLKDLNYSVDIIATSIANNLNIYDIYCKVKAIQEFLAAAEGEKIYLSIKRINNILLEATLDKNKIPAVNKKLFKTSYEQELYQDLIVIAPEIEELITAKQYTEAIKKFGELSNKISLFFDNVMVLDIDQEIRMNRLSLLQLISTIINKIADFSKVK